MAKTLYLLYSCNEWWARASLILITSDIQTLYAAICGEVLNENMEYDGKTGGKGFAECKQDYLAEEIIISKLKFGFVKEVDEAMLSEPDTLQKHHIDASEFLRADFLFEADAFDSACNDDSIECFDDEPDDECELEI